MSKKISSVVSLNIDSCDLFPGCKMQCRQGLVLGPFKMDVYCVGCILIIEQVVVQRVPKEMRVKCGIGWTMHTWSRAMHLVGKSISSSRYYTWPADL